jgi:hypothetical protein
MGRMLTSKIRPAAAILVAIGALTVISAEASAAKTARSPTTGGHHVKTKTRPSTISAFPANPSATRDQRNLCQQWTNRLQADEGLTLKLDGNVSTPQPNPKLEADADAAMDDGCVVIY